MLFFGHVFSENGLSPDPKKVEALQRVAPPTNVSEVRSLLSSAAFCSRFIKDFAVITKPLRQLTCKGVKWQWSEVEQQSFESLKAALSVKTTLAYYDPQKATSIFVDGSPVGLGAVLTSRRYINEGSYAALLCKLPTYFNPITISTDRPGSSIHLLGNQAISFVCVWCRIQSHN